jgi:peptidylprolyl isomerase
MPCKEGNKTSTGLKYVIKKADGKTRQRRSIIHPLCRFSRRWTPFDTSIENVAQTYGKFDPARAAQNGYQPIPFQSEKDGMIPGFIEGLNYLW